MLLPVDPAVVSANPRFDALYRDLCTNKLDGDGTSKLDVRAQRERDGREDDLKKARTAAAKEVLVTDGLQRLACRGGELPDELQEVVAIMAALIDGQVAKADMDVFEDDLLYFRNNADLVAERLAQHWRRDALLLARIADPDTPPALHRLAATLGAIQDSTTAAHDRLAQLRFSLAHQSAQLQAQHRALLQQLIRSLEQTLHGAVSRATKARAEYLALVAEGMGKKLAVQRAQLVGVLYSGEFCEALRGRRERLVRDGRVLRREVGGREEVLGEFEGGKGMRGVAEEYAEVVAEVERVGAEIGRLEAP